MTTLIRVFDESGHETRRCDARCHRANPTGVGVCVCGGALRGIERRGIDPLSLDDDYLNWVRTTLVLRPGEHVELRIGA